RCGGVAAADPDLPAADRGADAARAVGVDPPDWLRGSCGPCCAVGSARSADGVAGTLRLAIAVSGCGPAGRAVLADGPALAALPQLCVDQYAGGTHAETAGRQFDGAAGLVRTGAAARRG